MIRYQNLSTTGLKVSRIALGCGFRGVNTLTEAQGLISEAIDKGVNFIDCANIYAVRSKEQSEIALGKAIKGKRDKVIITTKFGSDQQTNYGEKTFGASAKVMREAIHNSLKRLNTDYVDVYFLHCPDTSVSMEETIIAFNDLIKEGKIRNYGFCNYSALQLQNALDISKKNSLLPPTVVQDTYNLINRKLENDTIPLIEKNNLGLMIYGPVAAGILSGSFSHGKTAPEKSTWGHSLAYQKYFNYFFHGRVESVVDYIQDMADEKGVSSAAIALAWLLDKEVVTTCISGSDSMEELNDSLSAFNVVFSSEEISTLNSLTEGLCEELTVGYVTRRVQELGL